MKRRLHNALLDLLLWVARFEVEGHNTRDMHGYWCLSVLPWLSVMQGPGSYSLSAGWLVWSATVRYDTPGARRRVTVDGTTGEVLRETRNFSGQYGGKPAK